MTISRSLLAIGLLAAGAAAAPVLTTIQDVLYKADGTRFNGNLSISWNSFQAADNTTVVTQSSMVKVVDGNLRVQLIPSTSANPARTYSVTYNSDGRIMFTETWSVPSSAVPLKVRDVRMSTASGGTAPGQITGTIDEADVIGLIPDLVARPLKGPGYAPGRVVIVNPSGALESAIGADTDCVRVDGSTGPCGGAASSFVDAEPLAGLVDGSNGNFTVNATADPPGSLQVFRNGLLQTAGTDYTVTGRNLQFAASATPQPGDTLVASYRLGTLDPNTRLTFPIAQVLCSGLGAATASPTLASVTTCTIPAGNLFPGDRIEIHFDFDHQGAAADFSFEIAWGLTTLLHRDVVRTETQVAGRIDVGALASGARASSQSWGAVLPLAAAVGTASDDYSASIIIDFRASSPGDGDTVTLRHFTVVRFP